MRLARRRTCGSLLAATALLWPALGHAERAAPAASFTALDEGDNHRFAANGGSASSVTIAPGDSVSFAYPAGDSSHDVRFETAQPSSCTQTAGPDGGPVPPLPAGPQPPVWAGTCTFTQEGRYPFFCDIHGEMTGTVIVTAPPPPPGSTPTPAATSAPAPAPSTAPTGPAASAAVVARHQRGSTVRGSIRIARPGSRLEVDLLARRSALGRKGTSKLRVGRTVKAAAGARRTTFSVPLTTTGTKALRHAGRLALTVKIAVAPAGGTPFAATMGVTLKRR